MARQRRVVTAAIASALLASLVAVSSVSAHGSGDASVFQRYDELFVVGIFSFVLVLGLAIGASWRRGTSDDQPEPRRPRQRRESTLRASRRR